MKVEIVKMKNKEVEKRTPKTLQISNEGIPEGFIRNYSEATNQLNNLNHQMAQSFETLTKQLENSINEPIKTQ